MYCQYKNIYSKAQKCIDKTKIRVYNVVTIHQAT
nr:MAG TPA: hypothetical protein [Caudoviricetes sp.]